MNLLLFNLRMDAGHTALGFTTAWTNALARRSQHVSVITMFKGEIAVEPNVAVHSVGKERGWSEPRRLLEFYRLVRQVLAKRRIDACFAHMAPEFASLFAPVAKVSRIPVLLWYAHGAVSPRVRLAHRLADRCVTSTPSGFRIPSDKLFVIGQGIDTEVFRPPTGRGDSYANTAISIGRLSRTKRLEEMLSALALLRNEHGIDLRLELTGEPLTDADQEYERQLRREVESLQLSEAVAFCGAVPFREIPSRYHRGSLFLNLSENRSIDKAILESMASGCIPISRNESFRALATEHGLETLIAGPGPEGVANSLLAVLRLTESDRAALAKRLRAIVGADHSLGSLADKLIHHLTELAEAKGRRGE